jgi:hypothetical protein
VYVRSRGVRVLVPYPSLPVRCPIVSVLIWVGRPTASYADGPTPFPWLFSGSFAYAWPPYSYS